MSAQTANHEVVDPLIGRLVAPFRILASLGRGAMGRVYLARHEMLGRRAAIKVLEPDLATHPETLARFVDEARVASAIRHPNIVDIMDFGEVDGLPYYVMELLEGETLGDRIAARGRLGAPETVRVCAQVAAAVAALHDHGVIHRDIKPENIFLCTHPDYPDHVKVLDFGVAKLVDRGRAWRSAGQTQAGTVLGTPLYMSPEQSLGLDIDARSDVYALGVVMFEALTGVSPFRRPTCAETLMAQVQETPPAPRLFDPAIPAGLEAVVMRALHKQPDGRFDDMRALRAAMIAVVDAPAPPPDRERGAAAASTPAPAPVPRVAQTIEIAPGAATVAPAASSSSIADVLQRIIVQRIEGSRLVLPVLSRVAQAALAELAKHDANLGRVADVIAQDPLLAPQVMRLASSAAFGAAHAPRTIQHAVVRLGLVRVRSVLLELSARRVFDSRQPRVADAFRGLWEHSLVVAALARQICHELGDPVDPELVHVGGLLHDVGKPLVAVLLLEAERAIQRGFQLDRATWLDVVARTHRRVGIVLARKWRLGDELQRIIADAGTYRDGAHALPGNIVCFAHAIAELAGKSVEPIDHEVVETTIAEGAERLQLDWRLVHDLRERADEVLRDPA